MGAAVSDFYHDDPVEELSSPRKKPKALFGSVLLLFAGGLFLNTTLAANINLNSGGRVEFGQGASLTTACSQGSSLTVTPQSEFRNVAGAGAYYVKSIKVSGIPSSCNEKDFNISLYDNVADSAPLPLFETSTAVATVWNNGGTFEQGYKGTGSTITSGSGTFTVTFNSPVALSSDAQKITVESAEHRNWGCADGKRPCLVGETGPGGGTVFYASAPFTMEGSECGTSCRNLQWAPQTWSGGASDPQIRRWSSDGSNRAQPNPIPGGGGGDTTLGSGAFGQGFINTQRMLTSNGATGYVADSSGAAYRVSQYAATDNSAGKWFLPSVQELIAIRSSSVFASGGFLTGPIGGNNPIYWSSSESDVVDRAFYVFLLNSTPARQNNPKSGDGNFYVRPIRAF